jgi:hypothetical protein
MNHLEDVKCLKLNVFALVPQHFHHALEVLRVRNIPGRVGVGVSVTVAVSIVVGVGVSVTVVVSVVVGVQGGHKRCVPRLASPHFALWCVRACVYVYVYVCVCVCVRVRVRVRVCARARVRACGRGGVKARVGMRARTAT